MKNKKLLLAIVAAIVIFAVVGYTGALDVLIVFLGYMSLKVTAYLQPITHKLYNLLFHETDPVPEPMPEELPAVEEESGRWWYIWVIAAAALAGGIVLLAVRKKKKRADQVDSFVFDDTEEDLHVPS